jgi:selenocysteine lyase/cysteine desulfurase
MDLSGQPAGEMSTIPFGYEMRQRHFSFAEGYRTLNHGSYGTSPKAVLEYQRQLHSEVEARPDTFVRYTSREYLKPSRVAIAGMLGVETNEVIFVPNTTTGINTVLRNLSFGESDTIIHFNTIYGADLKTLRICKSLFCSRLT